ncbi:hypothetical protein BURMUCF1_2148 [Burkholderia multivorans ATCC BAA-247]|jgi:hypothetical protein|uniref:Uncharacterized protein n=1 Tax=Burkholderia multivorans CGD2 TaxID=513052 RepID=B9BYY8_9BURK|nr:hypothetical protein BURMUCGD2_1441 [Burkholderia multivorans CGD2]EEE14806.1 hypothetical protein BURMUCGD2M_1538 [Burkholderia multivorans CGD2M]EJO56885.1 hypothetical protein BURMUCF1_2148 [Burkholderia multivorans ATCC BAA-247]
MRQCGEAAWRASIRAYVALPRRNNTASVVAADAVFFAAANRPIVTRKFDAIFR